MSKNCKHCNLPNRNETDEFCCHGCSFAYQIINNLGFENYYKSRHLDPKIKAMKPDENSIIDISSFASEIFDSRSVSSTPRHEDPKSNHFSINLLIEGMHCAACAWLIENVLKKQEKVVKARVNMTSKKLYLEWSGDILDGNKLVKLIFDLGYRLLPYDAEFLKSSENKYNSSLLRALAIAGFASGNVMLISFALWANSSEEMGVATRNLLFWVSALIALPAIIYSGRIFVISAFNSIKNKRMNMDVPIAVAIILASLISIFESITKGEHTYFDSVIMLVFFLLIGRYLDFSARKYAFGVTGDLMMLSGTAATIIENGKHKIIPVKNLQKDMILSVTMGEKISADGVIVLGSAQIDTSVITGESIPQTFKVGDDVYAGMINLVDPLQIKITKASNETLLSKIVAMVENIENSKNHYTQIADKIAKYYTPITHLLALATFLIWCFGFDIGWHKALLNATAVLLITCPCALALAVPVAKIISMGRLLKQGILIKNSEALEKLNEIDVVVFDKTGTLTIGKPTLVTSDKLLVTSDEFKIAASMAVKSKHILSQALVKEFKGELIDLDVKEIVGQGLIANYQGEQIRLGNANHSNCELEFVTPTQVLIKADNWNEHKVGIANGDLSAFVQQNNPQIFLKYKNQITVFTFQDQLKSDAKEVIGAINKQIILLSGDRKEVVESIAGQLGIKEFYFEKTPDQKLEILQKLKSQNYTPSSSTLVETRATTIHLNKGKQKNILMIGDGVNDAPSLMLADVSISPSSASDISKNIADIIFQGEKLLPILEIIRTAKKTDQIMKQNLFFALVYNLFAVPFACFGYVVPLFAALAMSSSSIVVVLNALRIKRN